MTDDHDADGGEDDGPDRGDADRDGDLDAASNAEPGLDPDPVAEFEADLAAAAEMLSGDDVDGFYAGVVRSDELDYAFGHLPAGPETVGTQALALAAKHLQVIADEAGVPVQQVADDAAQFATAFDDGE